MPKKLSESTQSSGTVSPKQSINLASDQLLRALGVFATIIIFPKSQLKEPTLFASLPPPACFEGQGSIENTKGDSKSSEKCEEAKLHWNPF